MSDLARNVLGDVMHKISGFKPKVGLILGSGLGGIVDRIEVVAKIPYSDCPGFFVSTVPGHKGEFVFGHLNGLPVVAMNGRVHLYEGASAAQVLAPVRLMRLLGASSLVVTGATGSLRKDLGPGSIVLLKDQINLSGINVLVGPNDAEYGPRFVGMENAYDPHLRTVARHVAEKLNIEINEGIYLGLMGPSYETKMEVRLYATLGGDVVGMSVVNDVIAAVHCGLKVLGFALVTNLGAGLSETLVNHQEVIDVANIAGKRLATLVEETLCVAAAENSL